MIVQNDDRGAETQARADALRSLSFPQPAEYRHGYAISYEHRYRGTTVSLKNVPLVVPDSPEQQADRPLLTLGLTALCADDVIVIPPDHISVKLTAAYPLILPEKTYARDPTQIVADGVPHRFRPGDFTMELAVRHRPEDATVVAFDVPMEDFLAIIQSDVITGRAGSVSFEIPDDVQEAMLDFASRLKPGARIGEPR